MSSSQTTSRRSLQNPPRTFLQSPVGPRIATEVSAAHLVGICGAGMKALAEMLTGLGWSVTGSDLARPNPTIEALERRGLRVHFGHQETFVPPDADVLVYSPAVAADNPERQIAARLGIRQLSYSQMLGELMRTRVGVSIAGTHGKSTTTAMTACILTDAGLKPSAIVGAELCELGKSGWAGEGELFVVESCEYQRSFLDLSPRHAAILGIEPDHFDCFATTNDMQSAFASFAGLIAQEGTLLVRGDCAASLDAARSTRARVETFGLEHGANWWGTDLRQTNWGMRFRIFHNGEFFAEVPLQLSGRHNALNALSAAALAHAAGASANAIRESLSGFRGIRRRYEEIGSFRGITIIDDYAHHPTAVRTTLESARQQFGGRRIWCAFQPHQISRTRSLMNQFCESFSAADEILIAPIYAARENPASPAEETAQELVRGIAASGVAARFCPSLDRIIATIDDEARPGDVLITMGAGDIDRVYHEFARRLQRHHAAG